ncbi:MAG TPA: DUF1015 family protein [Euzebyales bacterium]|nr:DUF1015 family protein [Euzebyales bacterium]
MATAPDATSHIGIRPAPLHLVDPALAPRVAAPAFDSIAPPEAAADPLSYLHVLRMPDGEDELRTALRADRSALERLLESNVFDGTTAPRFAWYRLSVGGHEQTALIAEVAIDDYERGCIVPHEHTRTDVEERLAAHLDAVGANSSPVALAHTADDRLRALRHQATTGPPHVRFVSSDGVQHTLWTTEDPDLIDQILAAVRALDRLYITDGHHRFAAGARVAAARRAAGAGPDAPDQWLLAALFPADELRILPFHRAVVRPRDLSTAELIAGLDHAVDVRPLPGPTAPDRAHHYAVYVDGHWLELAAEATGDGPLDTLDVVVLQQRVLAPVFGVTQPRLDPRLHYIAGGPAEVAAHCDREHAVGFVVRATTMGQLMAVADAGLAMPPKSTRFDPKVRSGLVLRLLH